MLVSVNCSSSSPSPRGGFVPTGMPEQSLAPGWCPVTLPGGVSSFNKGIQPLLVANTATGPFS